jgi:hypothetical protein
MPLSIRPDRHTHWVLLPSVTTDIFTLALQHFAQAVGASKQKQIVLVLDRADWHTSKALIVPARTSSALPASLFSRVTAGFALVALVQ